MESKMKKKLLILSLLLTSFSALAFNADILSNWPFSAPHVSDKDDLDSGYAVEGDILYDQTDNAFYGRNNSAWVELGGSAPSNLVTTSDSQEWGIESAFVEDGSSVGTVSRESGDWINGNCSESSSGIYVCTIQTGIFGDLPNCVVSSDSTTGSTVLVDSATQFTVTPRNSSGSKTPDDFNVICHGPRP